MPPPDVLLKPIEEMPEVLPVPPLAQSRGGPAAFVARVRPPGSKSLTNRALLLAGLAEGNSTIRGALVGADDAERMVAGLRALGAGVDVRGDVVEVRGVGGRWSAPEEVRLGLGNAGTAVRFLASAAVLGRGPVVIDGNARMRERPIGELVEALEQLGAQVEYLGKEGCPPLRVRGPEEMVRGARVELGETASSQYITGLLLIAPFWPGGLTLVIEGNITSRSYVSMTLGLLDTVGARVRTSDDLRVMRVSSEGLRGFDYTVEPDASGATYFWGAAAICPGSVCRVAGLEARSLQGDAGFAELLGRMGATVLREEGKEPSLGVRGPAALEPVMADMSLMPDAAMTLAVVTCFARGRSIIRGLKTLRVKESDRIAALQNELAKVGVRVEVSVLGDPDAITIMPPAQGMDCGKACEVVEFETYDDHRMAMSLALIGLKRPNTWVRNPACVGKTYPGFWKDLAGLY
jgi:3-phosphoshikimate 1-carboxyvinyltransferase